MDDGRMVRRPSTDSPAANEPIRPFGYGRQNQQGLSRRNEEIDSPPKEVIDSTIPSDLEAQLLNELKASALDDAPTSQGNNQTAMRASE